MRAPGESVGLMALECAMDELAERLDLECVRASLDALEQNRDKDYLSAATDDVELFPGGREKVVRGKDGLLGFIRALHKSIGQLDTTIENVPIKTVVIGDAYVERTKTTKPQTLVCIIGDKGKVLLTLFSDK